MICRFARIIRSITGMMKNTPGPLAPCERPSRKITPRSYSCTTLIEAASRIRPRITTIAITAISAFMASGPPCSAWSACSASAWWPRAGWRPDVDRRAVEPDHRDRVARREIEHVIGGGVPSRSLDHHDAGRPNPPVDGGGPTDQRFHAGEGRTLDEL